MAAAPTGDRHGSRAEEMLRRILPRTESRRFSKMDNTPTVKGQRLQAPAGARFGWLGRGRSGWLLRRPFALRAAFLPGMAVWAGLFGLPPGAGVAAFRCSGRCAPPLRLAPSPPFGEAVGVLCALRARCACGRGVSPLPSPQRGSGALGSAGSAPEKST